MRTRVHQNSENRIIGVRSFVLAILVVCLAIIGSVSASTLYVDDDGVCSGNSPCYLSIQEGLDDAFDGDIIKVSPGQYFENLNVYKSVKIIGEGRESTLVKAINSKDHVFYVNDNNVDISGFTITGADSYNYAGIFLDRVENTVIYNTILTDNHYGIFTYRSENITIKDNLLSDNKYGLKQYYSSNNNLARNNIFHNGFGLFFYMSSNNEINHNKVISSSNYGISIDSSNNNLFFDNYFNNSNNMYLYSSINAWNTTPQSLKNIVDGENIGGNLWLSPDNSGFSQKCVDYNNDWFCDSIFTIYEGNIDHYPIRMPEGIFYVNKSGFCEGFSPCYSTMQAAINVASDGSTVKVAAGEYRENLEIVNSISLIGESPETVFITSNDNEDYVISVTAGSVNISGFTISDGRGGIYLAGVNNGSIWNNSITNNSRGISLLSSKNNILGNNNLTNNAYGLYLITSDNNTIQGNRIRFNSDYGIAIRDFSTNNRIFNNYLENRNNTFFEGEGVKNQWNTTKTVGKNIMGGSYLGGNFWSNPDGMDFSNSCPDLDFDGFCDSGHRISSENVDHYPMYSDDHSASTWYFAEGYTSTNFYEYLLILNPNNSTVKVQINYIFSTGSPVIQNLTILPGRRAKVDVGNFLGSEKAVSIKAVGNLPIIAERQLFFNYNSIINGAHSTLGATKTSKKWYFAEGYLGENFFEYLCLLNPNEYPANVEITYIFGNGSNYIQSINVPGNQRTTIDVKTLFGMGKGVSVIITSDIGIVAERSMYFIYEDSLGKKIPGGHESLGISKLSDHWYFAEGYTGENFIEYLILFNPHNVSASATVTYIFANGTVLTKNPVSIEPSGRSTINVNEEIGLEEVFSTTIESTLEIAVERSMYFNYAGTTKGGHNSVGGVKPGILWYIVGGDTNSGLDGYLTIINPNHNGANISVTYMFINGSAKDEYIYVSPIQRHTITLKDTIAGGQECSLKLESNESVYVEMMTYYKNWMGLGINGGTSTRGYAP